MTSVIKLCDTSHGEDVNIGDLLVREGLAAPANLDDSYHTPKAVNSSSVLDLEGDKGSYVGSSSCSLDQEETASQQEGGAAQSEVTSSQAEYLDAPAANSAAREGSKSGQSFPAPGVQQVLMITPY